MGMGTNYYLYTGRSKSPLHIGKSSYGWRFNLHCIPGVCDSLDDWVGLMSRAGRYILNEYDELVKFGEMVDIILRRGVRFPGHPYCPGTDCFNPARHDIYTAWDPYNRLCRYNINAFRGRLNSSGCVESLDKSTYDMWTGEYS